MSFFSFTGVLMISLWFYFTAFLALINGSMGPEITWKAFRYVSRLLMPLHVLYTILIIYLVSFEIRPAVWFYAFAMLTTVIIILSCLHTKMRTHYIFWQLYLAALSVRLLSLAINEPTPIFSDEARTAGFEYRTASDGEWIPYIYSKKAVAHELRLL